MSKPFVSSDEALVLALRKGDNEALKYVYKTYWPMISRFVRENSGTEEDAEELYQEGIIALYERLRSANFTLTCSLKTYIYSVCRNKWLQTLRGRKAVVDLEAFEEIDNGDDALDMPAVLPENTEVVHVITTLGDPCYTLLIGFYYHQMSLDDLAAKLKYASANVAKQQKFRCVEKLKKIFLEKESIRQ